MSPSRRLPLFLRVLHWFIIVHFSTEALYCGYMTLFVMRPDEVTGPLFEVARSVPFELLASRRLYAIETWVASAGLAVYLAITEMLPRMLRPEP